MSKRLVFILFVIIANFSRAQNLVNYVNPMVGTDAHGHTFPGATVPFGFMQLSPDTRNDGSWDGCSGYHYSDKQILGFSHTHLSGTGCSDYGDILIMPSNKHFGNKSEKYASTFLHTQEKAEPGYYEVYLQKPNVKASFTTTERSGIHKYEFDTNDSQMIFLDLLHRDEVIDAEYEIWNPTTIRGYRYSKAWAKEQKIYFEIQFSKPFAIIDSYKNDSLTHKPYMNGKKLQSLFIFDNDKNNTLYVKIGISAVSAAGAANNLKNEIPDWSFEKVKANAQKKWEKELSKLYVEDNKEEKKKVFYTSLYHCMLSPNIFNDYDGKYRGMDNKIYNTHGKFNYYTVFSIWDTYRALHPLLTIVDRKRANDFILTFLEQYKQVGRLPVWELSANETDCMIGYHAASVIYDAFSKGIKDYDTLLAFDAMKSFAMSNERGLESYKKFGYVRTDDEAESVSKTLEYAYDDWCIAQMAKALHKDSDYVYFNNRSYNYRNIFDAKTGFMHPVINGSFTQKFSPYTVDNNFTEANSWQYSFYAPHHIKDLISLHGSSKNFEKKLDELFTANTQTEGREQADITGLIGQYAHGNEPSHHIAYLYNYVGANTKAEKIVHKILDSFYSTKPDGLIGNEDCGQMSAWFVLSSMGIYPTCPGSTNYDAIQPYFDKIKIKISESKTVEIKKENYDYVKSVYKKVKIIPQLAHDSLINYGNASTKYTYFTFNDTNTTQFIANPIIENANQIFKEKQTISFVCNDKLAEIYYSANSSPFGIYNTPIEIANNALLNFYSKKGDNTSPIQQAFFYKLPDDRTVTIKSKYSKSYSAGGDEALFDGLHGTTEWRAGKWQGYQAQDFEATINFKDVKNINDINITFLQDQKAWIFFPTEVKIYTSTDNINFSLIEKQKIDVPRDDEKNSIKKISVHKNFNNIKFVKVIATNYGKIPAWHPGAGYDAYIFIDEIDID